MVFYSQRDKCWAAHIYSARPPHTETLKSSGCGPTSGASVVASLTGDLSITPPVASDWAVKRGYRIDGVGTANAFFKAYYEANSLTYRATDFAGAKKCLDAGGLVACGTGGKPLGLFSTGGHFFLLVGYEGTTLKFWDPDAYAGKYTAYADRKKYCTLKSDGFVYVEQEWARPEINLYYCATNEKKEELTMEQYNEIMEKLDGIAGQLREVELVTTRQMVYNYVDDNMPGWARETIQKLMDKGYLKGVNENGDLDLTDKDLRMYVILDRAGAFGA